MLVCHCYGVSESRIREAVREGADTSESIRRACFAGGGCGSCRTAVVEILQSERTRRDARPAAEAPPLAAG
jgi:bacterioferritin-associated ferredoxin